MRMIEIDKNCKQNGTREFVFRVESSLTQVLDNEKILISYKS
jgi:hypothetical protein